MEKTDKKEIFKETLKFYKELYDKKDIINQDIEK